MTTSSTSNLCQTCGLCCDGTLFDHAPLTREEVERLSGFAVRIRDATGASPVLLQPCSALRGSLCTVYENRPTPCRAYECLLVAALRSGEVTLDEAKATVREARERLGLLVSGLPMVGNPRTTSDLQRAKQAAATDRPELRAEVMRLEQFLRRHFLGRQRTL